MKQLNHIVLFDGVCNLCNGSVQFLIKHDKNANLKYASLQSEIGKELCNEFGVDAVILNSIIFISEGKAYNESSAVLRITKFLDFPYNVLRIFVIVPKFIRNPIYRWIARNRYKWFGKEEKCMLPSESISARFIG